jgi:hypothetical protein
MGREASPVRPRAGASEQNVRLAAPCAEIVGALGREGKAAEGLSILDKALARSEFDEERQCIAELWRDKGELILR